MKCNRMPLPLPCIDSTLIKKARNEIERIESPTVAKTRPRRIGSAPSFRSRRAWATDGVARRAWKNDASLEAHAARREENEHKRSSRLFACLKRTSCAHKTRRHKSNVRFDWTIDDSNNRRCPALMSKAEFNDLLGRSAPIFCVFVGSLHRPNVARVASSLGRPFSSQDCQ